MKNIYFKWLIITVYSFCALLISAKDSYDDIYNNKYSIESKNEKGVTKKYKINNRIEIRPYSIIIERAWIKSNTLYFYCKIKQQKRFSYSVSFEDCRITTSDSSEDIKGKLIEWNNKTKINNIEKTISDDHEETFVLEFPVDSISDIDKFDLTIGTILNNKKTPLVIENLSLQGK